jgi:hypothetical protein
MEECYFIDKYGAFKTEKFDKLDSQYTLLNCIIQNKISFSDIYYPYIIASTQDKYLTKIKIAINAVKNNLKFIEMTPKMNSHEYQIIVFNDIDEDFNKAVLVSYLVKNFRKKQSLDFNPIDFIIQNLQFNDNNTFNKYHYLSRYVNRIVPTILPEETEKIMSNPKLNMKQKYMAKYNLIKKYDNFKDFNKKYSEIQVEAGKILEKTKKSKDFINYIKTVKVKPFAFTVKHSIGNNPLYETVKPAVEKYAKDAGIEL